MKFHPVTHKDEQQILEYLSSKDIHVEETNTVNDVVSIYVNGDWKHTHARLDYLMKENHYICIGEMVEGDDSSDWYSSFHYFMKELNPRKKFSVDVFEKQLKKKNEKIIEDIKAGKYKLTLVEN